MSKKLVVTDGTREREMLLVGRIVVGRDPSCDITLDHSLLSRRHAEFVTANDLVVVRDLGSRNGVFVNGIKTAEQSLKAGDVVQVGPLRAEYVLDRAPLSIAPEDHDADRTAVIHSVPPEIAATPVVSGSGAVPREDDADDEEATRLISSPRPSASRSGPVAAAPAPMVAPAPDDDEATRFIPAPQPKPDLDNETTTEEVVVARASTPQPSEAPQPSIATLPSVAALPSLRNYIFLRLLVFGGFVLVTAAVVLTGADSPWLTTALIVPTLVVVVAGYLVSGVIDRRLASALAEQRERH